MEKKIKFIHNKEIMNQIVSLGNYLGKLFIKRCRGNDEIRVYGIRNFLRSKLDGKSLIELSRFCDIKYKNIRNWIGNTKTDVGIPLTQLMKIAIFMEVPSNVVFENVCLFGGTNTKKYSLPKYITPKLAYLMGYIMGDGHLATPSDTISNGSEYNAEIRITTNEKYHLEYLQQIFLDLFSYKPPLFKEKTFYRLIGRSKVIHRFLAKVCGIPTGNKKEKTLVPSVLNKNHTLEKYFLSGFFDADGSVAVSKNKVRGIRIKQHNERILKQCYKILKEDGIKSLGIYRDNGLRNGKITKAYVLAIQNQPDIQHFIRNFFSLKILDRGAKLMQEFDVPRHVAIIPDGN